MKNLRKDINKQAVVDNLKQAVIDYKNDNKKLLDIFKCIAVFIDIDAESINSNNKEQMDEYIALKLKEYRQILNK